MTLISDFKKWQKQHPNAFTDTLVKTLQTQTIDGQHDLIIEKSKGRGVLTNKTMYGICVFKRSSDEHLEKTGSEFQAVNHDLNQSFHDENEADTYLRNLRQELGKYTLEEIKNGEMQA
jgi:hypothetical protein